MRYRLYHKKVNEVKTNILSKNFDLDESFVSDYRPAGGEPNNGQLMTDLSSFLKQTWKTSDEERASTNRQNIK